MTQAAISPGRRMPNFTGRIPGKKRPIGGQGGKRSGHVDLNRRRRTTVQHTQVASTEAPKSKMGGRRHTDRSRGFIKKLLARLSGSGLFRTRILRGSIDHVARLSHFPTGKEFVSVIQKAGRRTITPYAQMALSTIWPKPGIEKAGCRSRLLLTTPRNLGFGTGVSRGVFFARATGVGLSLCTCLTGPVMFSDLGRQFDRSVSVAMEPIITPGGTPVVFRLGNQSGQRQLCGDIADDRALVHPDEVFVFELEVTFA